MSCDLHIHSTCSDGAVPIERLASIAARTGLHAIALSDHDTLLSAQYAYAHTGQDGVELIPAVELTGYDFERQHRVHLLCYYPDVDCPALREHCAIMKERRNACALQSAKELEQLYPQFTTDLAWETTKASGVLFKSGLMQALELLGLTDGSIYGETYHKLFGWNPRGIVLHSPELPFSMITLPSTFLISSSAKSPNTAPAIGVLSSESSFVTDISSLCLSSEKVRLSLITGVLSST